MSEAPSLQDEIERKAVETLEKLHTDRESGRINGAQYAYGVDVLWGTVAGLVSKDVMIMFKLAGKPCRNSDWFSTKIHVDKGGVIARIDNMHNGCVRVQVGSSAAFPRTEKLYNFTEELNPHEAAQTIFQTLNDKMFAKGYTEL